MSGQRGASLHGLIKRFGRANLEEVFLAIARRGSEDLDETGRVP